MYLKILKYSKDVQLQICQEQLFMVNKQNYKGSHKWVKMAESTVKI